MECSPTYEGHQRNLQQRYEAAKSGIVDTVREICSAQVAQSEEYMKKKRAQLDCAMEELHLSISNYFGFCDRENQKLECRISEQIDVADFDEIGAELCKM